MHRPQNEQAVQGLDGYEQKAKTYWRLWGPLGEPMVRGVDAWAEMQRGYILRLRQTYPGGKQL